ncbi:hypothetical protein GE061_005093 [Apolygus lucorum]|uniref:Uncharacterized protein n=1 Tax=Apolygus lucorum TaxID=248454 RepID=A0A8S9WUP5_APOLU|nr:hypothetical protein GE061_005093 [Apolygus lucorum]
MNILALIIAILVAAAVTNGEDLVDQVFGEALLKSLNPALREKLEEIHSKGVFKSKTESQSARLVKQLLTTEEIKELEAAYKRLILPMLQDTIQKQTGRKYENLDDLPIEFEDDEEGDVEVDDFKTESEEQMERTLRENKTKEKKDKKEETPRTVNIQDDSVNKSGGSGNADKRGTKAKTESVNLPVLA